MRDVAKPLTLALVIVIAMGFAARPQPAAGAGSSEIVGVTSIGTGARETWVVLPNEPPSCLVVFLHPANVPTPSAYLGWLDYLATGMSCAVIFPRYQLSPTTTPTNSLENLRTGVSAGVVRVRRARFGFEKRRATASLRTVVVGIGSGGGLAFSYAANAARWGLPVPVAVDSIFPTLGQPAGLPPRPLSRSTRVLVQVNGTASPAEETATAEVRHYLASHPASRTRIQTLRSRRGADATVDATPAAAQLYWSPLDALIDGTG